MVTAATHDGFAKNEALEMGSLTAIKRFREI
jgi:hypothetical protein